MQLGRERNGSLFESFTKPNNLLSAHNRMLNEWQLLTDAPNLTNDRNVVVSGQSAFIANNRKADVRSAGRPTAANNGVNLLPL